MAHMPTYRYLNLERSWPLFQRQGLEIGEDGALRLARLAQLAPMGDPLEPVPGLEGPAGVAGDECGNIYIADPARHRVLRLDACGEAAEPLPCLRGPGTGPGQLHSPRGVAIGPRDTLYIADSRNARVVVVDLRTGQLRGIWDGRGAGPDGAPFAEPWDLAVDGAGRVYVADPGARLVGGGRSGGSLRRFDAAGRGDAAFAATLAAQEVRPTGPAAVTLTLLPGDTEERLLVIESGPRRLLVYEPDGVYDADATARWARALGTLTVPGAVAATGGLLYVSDAGRARVLAFDAAGSFLGVVNELPPTVAGLGVDCRGRLLVHPGGGAALWAALELPAFATCGTFLAGPFRAASDPTRWQRLRVAADPLPDGAHFRIYTLTSESLDGPGGAPAMPADCGSVLPGIVPADAEAAAPLDTWRAAPRDAADLLALNEPGEYLWIAGVLAGDGGATPILRQIELHHDEDGWLRYLPALYSRSAADHPFLRRALALFETGLDDLEAHIAALPRLFDPFAAPDRKDVPWLEWLAGWLDVPLEERWPEALRRQVVADAFGMHARRGTRESLRRLVELYAGVRPFIEEALPDPPAWSLGESMALGLETRLIPAPPGGAVLASTAVVDHSHLAPDEFGAPLFDDAAHLFFVSVYGSGDAGAAVAERVRLVLDREKPAHTVYHLCVIGARMRVGVQARLGIDAIVGGATLPPSRLGGGAELGRDSVLAGTSVQGVDARVGITTTLS